MREAVENLLSIERADVAVCDHGTAFALEKFSGEMACGGPQILPDENVIGSLGEIDADGVEDGIDVGLCKRVR